MTTIEPEDWPVPLALDLDDDVRVPLAAVRRWTGHILDNLDDDTLEDILLVVTELVANAFDHGQRPRRIRLRRSEDSCSVRVEVDDSGSLLPVMGTSRLGESRGMGMIIITRLTTGWGVSERPSGKTVWADIACTHSRTHAAGSPRRFP